MKDEVWVLGATGRVGTAIATRLDEAGVPLVLVGRDRGRLDGVVAKLDGTPRVVVGELESTLAMLGDDPPGVVVNTVGPFTDTAVTVARACPAGTHYVDIGNELPATAAILGLDRRAADAGQVLVTGAGFGVLATESVVLRLCEGQPRPTRVRVDSIASVDTDTYVVGDAFAATVVTGLLFGGREVRHGRLVRTGIAGRPAQLTTPDGMVVATGSGPFGDLLAAWRATDADSVVAAFAAVPSTAVFRFGLPAIGAILRIPGAASLATDRIARIAVRPRPRRQPFSWGHARVEWPSGRVRDGWLRAGEGHDFTAAVAAEVTRRLLDGEGRPGAHTPGALFGATLAEAAGGELLVGASR